MAAATGWSPLPRRAPLEQVGRGREGRSIRAAPPLPVLRTVLLLDQLGVFGERQRRRPTIERIRSRSGESSLCRQVGAAHLPASPALGPWLEVEGELIGKGAERRGR